jgi:hypothetical protein
LWAHCVDSLRCEGSDAIGAKRTCRERRERVDLTKMTQGGHQTGRNPAAQHIQGVVSSSALHDPRGRVACHISGDENSSSRLAARWHRRWPRAAQAQQRKRRATSFAELVQRVRKKSISLLPASPPAEQTAASQHQSRQSRADLIAGAETGPDDIIPIYFFTLMTRSS